MGVSRRALARALGVDDRTIRRRIAKGGIVALPDGTVEVVEVDQPPGLAAESAQPVKSSSDAALHEAIRRRLCATCQMLRDRLEAMRVDLLPAEGVRRLDAAIFETVAAILQPLPARLAPLVVGKRPEEAVWILSEHLHAALTAAGTTDLSERDLIHELQDPCPPPRPLDVMSETELATYRSDLLTAAITWRRLKSRGDLVAFDDMEWAQQDRLLRAASILR